MLGQLQRRADRVRSDDPRGGGQAEHAEYQLADRVGRQPAVATQLLPGLISAHALVDAIGLDQARERLARQPALAQRRLQAHEQRVRGPTLKRPVEILFEPVQRRQAVAGRGVAQLVDQASESIDGEQVRANAARQHPAGDGEVLALRRAPSPRPRRACRRVRRPWSITPVFRLPRPGARRRRRASASRRVPPRASARATAGARRRSPGRPGPSGRQAAAQRHHGKREPVEVIVDVVVRREAGARVLRLIPDAVRPSACSRASPRRARAPASARRPHAGRAAPRRSARPCSGRGRSTPGHRRSAGPRPSRHPRSGAPRATARRGGCTRATGRPRRRSSAGTAAPVP